MYRLPNYVRSLLLTVLISFAAPVAILGISLAGLSISSHFPGIAAIAQLTFQQMLIFLRIFGSGSAIAGLFIIGITCGLVGGLFDTYTYYQSYRYQHVRNGN
jgi:hypothetical protein